jgi:hypothetical protein
MKNTFSMFLALMATLTACKKDNSQPGLQGTTPLTTLSDYVKADSIGNYWIYSHNRVDSNGNVLATLFDSAYVSNDTITNGNSYMFVPNYVLQAMNFLRDSSGFLVNHYGDRFLTITNLPDTIEITNDIFYDRYKICEVYPGTITTPAGTFNNIIKTSTFVYFKPPMDTTFNPVVAEMYFAKDVGLIREKYFYFSLLVSSGEHFERELTAFSVQ